MKKPIFLAAILCGCLTAADLCAKEGAGFSFAGGKWNLSPTVNVGVFWQSNANDSANDEESDSGYHVGAAVGLSHTSKRTSFSSNAQYTMERGFDSDSGQDSDSYGFGLSIRRELAPRWNFGLSAAYSHSENDQFFDRPSSVSGISYANIYKDESDNYNLNASLGYRSSRWQFSGSAGWSGTKDEGRSGDSDSESNSYNVSFLAGRAIGARMYWNVSVSSSLDRPEDGDNSVSYSLMTGISGEVTGKTSYSAMLGLSMYDYSGYQDDTSVDPSYSMSIAHRFSRVLTLSAAMDSRYESENNGDARKSYSWSHNLTAAMNYQISTTLSARFNTTFSWEDHTATSGGGSYDRMYFQASAGLNYAFNTYISMYTSASWKTDIADGGQYDDDERDDIRLDAGLSFRF